MAQLLKQLRQKFTDANGNPLAGGKVYSYQAGTTTPLSTYTDYGGGTANANPVILDSNGEADIWIGSAGYKFVITDSDDNVLDTVDNVFDIANESIITSKIADDAVTTAKIADSNVTTAKINDLAVTTAKIATDAVTTVKIADSNITTAKINDGAVTQAKRASLTYNIGTGVTGGTASTSGSLIAPSTPVTASITTSGRPVFVGLISKYNASQASNIEVRQASGALSVAANFAILRDTTVVSFNDLYVDLNITASTDFIKIPPGCIWTIDDNNGSGLSAGTYTYSIQYSVTGSNNVRLTDVKLVAYEL